MGKKITFQLAGFEFVRKTGSSSEWDVKNMILELAVPGGLVSVKGLVGSVTDSKTEAKIFHFGARSKLVILMKGLDELDITLFADQYDAFVAEIEEFLSEVFTSLVKVIGTKI